MTHTGILIFGGTFDPPHRAHIVLPPLVAKQLGCERILYIPARCNPLKADEPATPAEHRLAMLRLAVAPLPTAEISTIELDRAGPSYTIDTLHALRRQHTSGAAFHLLIGSDQALDFHRWRDWRRILELATPAVMLRPPMDEPGYHKQLVEIHSPPEAQRWLRCTVHVPQMDIGAREIRRRLAEGGDVSDLLDDAVAEYIRSHALYGA